MILTVTLCTGFLKCIYLFYKYFMTKYVISFYQCMILMILRLVLVELYELLKFE